MNTSLHTWGEGTLPKRMDGVWSQCGNNFLVLIDPWPHLSLLSSPWPSNQDICGRFKNKYLGAWVDSLLILRSNPTLSYFRSAQLVIYIYVPIYAFTIFCWTEQSTRGKENFAAPILCRSHRSKWLLVQMFVEFVNLVYDFLPCCHASVVGPSVANGP